MQCIYIRTVRFTYEYVERVPAIPLARWLIKIDSRPCSKNSQWGTHPCISRPRAEHWKTLVPSPYRLAGEDFTRQFVGLGIRPDTTPPKRKS